MEENKDKIVLTGTHEGSYKNFRGSHKKNKKSGNILDLLLNKIKKGKK